MTVLTVKDSDEDDKNLYGDSQEKKSPKHSVVLDLSYVAIAKGHKAEAGMSSRQRQEEGICQALSHCSRPHRRMVTP
ncbi:hypothetical protein PoB_000280700 [Plakobranchus ocellatus]|uniref:Uncharacterized protein n=1 Tax=Plakobranchus ocellatus TaxID=259542 RepID=A0AAV3Y1H3_9GAST|nr:hypothetical protein PoB_000280700 [Plakobranchus ocellatus]